MPAKKPRKRATDFDLDIFDKYFVIQGRLKGTPFISFNVLREFPILQRSRTVFDMGDGSQVMCGIEDNGFVFHIDTKQIYRLDIIEPAGIREGGSAKAQFNPVIINGVNLMIYHIIEYVLRAWPDEIEPEALAFFQNMIDEAKKPDPPEPDQLMLYPEAESILSGYNNVPTSALTNIIKQFVNSPTRIESPRRGQIAVSEHYLTKDTVITYKGKDGAYVLSIERVKELFTKRVQNGAKIFNFLLQKLNEQNYTENTEFLLSDLVVEGIYSSPESAYKGLKTVLDKLMYMHVEGTVTIYQRGKKKEIVNSKAAVIAARSVTFNKCVAVLPQIIRNSAPYITILPRWSNALPENAYMLLDYIYYLARQNTDKMRERGHFNIKLDTIRQHLGFPSPKETKRHQQLIISPIEDAMTAIEDAQQGNELKITPFYNLDYKNIHDFLDGYIEISISGEAFDYMEQRAIAHEKERKAARARIEKAKKKQLEPATK